MADKFIELKFQLYDHIYFEESYFPKLRAKRIVRPELHFVITEAKTYGVTCRSARDGVDILVDWGAPVIKTLVRVSMDNPINRSIERPPAT